MIASMAPRAMRALLLTPILLATALRPPTQRYASLPRRALQKAAVAGGLGDAGPADDAKVRAWASQLRAVAAKRSPPAAAGVAVGLAGRVAATGSRQSEARGAPRVRLLCAALDGAGGAGARGRRKEAKARSRRGDRPPARHRGGRGGRRIYCPHEAQRRRARGPRGARALGPRRRGRLRRTRRDKGGGAAREPRLRARRPLRGEHAETRDGGPAPVAWT